MKNEIVLIMEEIEKDPEKLKLMFRIKEIDVLYEFFKENGYKQDFEKFKEEVNNFIESVGFLCLEDFTLENVVGGISMKNRLTKAISVGLASLMALGWPVSYASRVKVPRKSTSSSNNLLSKKLLKGIGISTTTIVFLLGINWLYKKYYSKPPIKQPKETSEQSQIPELDTLLASYEQQNRELEIKIAAMEKNVKKQEELIEKARAEAKDQNQQQEIEQLIASDVARCIRQKQEIAGLRNEMKENRKQQEQLIKQNI